MATVQLLMRCCLPVVISLALITPGAAATKAVRISLKKTWEGNVQVTKVSCTLNPSSTAMTQVNELSLYGTTEESQRDLLQVVASVNKWDPNPRLFRNPVKGKAQVKGVFGYNKGKSWLNVAMATRFPTSEYYRYRCAAEGSDVNGQRVGFSDWAEADVIGLYSKDDSGSSSESKDTDDKDDVSDEKVPSRPGNANAPVDASGGHAPKSPATDKLAALVAKVDSIAISSDDLGEKLTDMEGRLGELEIQVQASSDKQNTYNIAVQDLQQKAQASAQQVADRFQMLEIADAQNMNTINNAMQSVQSTIAQLQRTVANQAVSIKELEIREKFYATKELKGKRYFVSKIKTNFSIEDADATCVEFGGYLAEIDDEEEYEFLYGFVQNLAMSCQFAVGANDINEEGRFEFYHSKRNMTFSRWAENEPNNQWQREDCVSLNPLRGGMNDMPCTRKARYVCEVSI